MEDEDNYTGIRYAIGDLSDNIRNEARYADVFDATLDPYEPSIALPGEGAKKDQEEAIAALNALEDSITSLKDKGHDFIL